MRSPTKSLRWGWGEACYLFGMKQTIEMRPGWIIACHPLAYSHSYYAQACDPDQIAEFDSFIRGCTPGMVLFDIGAHFGLFSLAALHYGGPSARIVAVDASPTAARMLQIQFQLNLCSDRAHVVHACACDIQGVRDMVSVGVLSDGYFIPPSRDHGKNEVTPTPATTLDEISQRFRLQPTHLKIDVEGYEGDVLKGATGVLSADAPPVVWLELHNQIIRQRGGTPDVVLKRLFEFGYAITGGDGTAIRTADLLARPIVRIVATKEAME